MLSGAPADYFAPTDWQALDASDLDIGGSGPVLFDVPGASPSRLIIALGKNGNAYLRRLEWGTGLIDVAGVGELLLACRRP